MRKCLLLGAGFSYEFGMPLTSELTETFLGLINENNAEVLKERLSSDKPYSEDRPINKKAISEGIEYFIEYKSGDGNNYEEFLSGLNKLGAEIGRSQSDKDSFNYLFAIFYESIHAILSLYQKVSYEIMYGDVFKWFNKLNDLLSDNETWVFSLNHDIYFECLAVDLSIPISYGDVGNIQFPISNMNMNETVSFTSNDKVDINIKSPGFILNRHGINIVKLHGGLSELEYRDIICNLPLNVVTSVELMASFSQVENMAFYHGGNKIPSGREKVITNMDGELDIICKSMLTGGNKYSTTSKKKKGEEKLALMDDALQETDELTIIGYGFGDKHINYRISNSMVLNPNMVVRIIDPTSNKTPEFLEQFDYDDRIKKAYCGAPHWMHYYKSGKWDAEMTESLKSNTDKRYLIQVEVERRLHAGEFSE